MKVDWSFLYKVIKIVLSIILLMIMMEELGTVLGIAGWIGFYVLWAIVMMIRKWSTITMVMDKFQTIIWGKPLKQFTKEELRNTKVKFVWGKKNNTKTQK